MKIKSEVVLKLMSTLGYNREKMREAVGYSDVEGFNKALRKGNTKDTTAKKIAEVLGVHISVISGEKMKYQKSQLIESDDERLLFMLKNTVERHELEIRELNDKYTKLLEKLSGLS